MRVSLLFFSQLFELFCESLLVYVSHTYTIIGMYRSGLR